MNEKSLNERLNALLKQQEQKRNEDFEELGLESLELIQGGSGSGCTSMCGTDCGIF